MVINLSALFPLSQDAWPKSQTKESPRDNKDGKIVNLKTCGFGSGNPARREFLSSGK
jgi:hypothetical protein